MFTTNNNTENKQNLLLWSTQYKHFPLKHLGKKIQINAAIQTKELCYIKLIIYNTIKLKKTKHKDYTAYQTNGN